MADEPLAQAHPSEVSMVLIPALALALTVARPMVTPIAVLVKVDGSPKFDTMLKDEARNRVRDAIRVRVVASVKEFGYYDSAPMNKALTDFEDHFDSKKAGDKGAWGKLATATNAGPIMMVELVRYSQKNLSSDALLNNPRKPASETKASVRLWWYDPSTGILTALSGQLEGVAGAGYFGTTDQSELQGSPESKGLEIERINRKRIDAIGKAVWAAVKAQIPKV